MKPDELTTIMEMLDDVIRNRKGTSLFNADRSLTNIGSLWAQEVEAVNDPALATEAVAGLFIEATFEHVPTVSEFQDQVRRKRRLQREAAQARAQVKGLPLPTDMPEWAPAKLLAMAAGDYRVWPEQRPGYDANQREYPFFRTYVWGEQELMPIEQREVYEEKMAGLTIAERLSLMRKVFSGT